MSTTLRAIGGVGFMFEVSQTLKHNLICPDVLSFFDGVQKCTILECEIRQNDAATIITFYIDHSLNNKDIMGVISKRI